MTRSDFFRLYEFNDWANDRLCTLLKTAFGEETDLLAQENPLCASIQATTFHIIEAQAIWRSRWQEIGLPLLHAEEYRTPFELRMAFGAERARTWGFLQELSEEAVTRPVVYRSLKGELYTQPLSELLTQPLFHAMYHRGQVTAYLIECGHEDSLPITDFIAFAQSSL